MRGLGRSDLKVRRNAAAAKDLAPAVGQFDLAPGSVLFLITVIVVVVERDARVFALDQPSTGRVVLGGGECKAGIFCKRINRLDQTFAEGSFTHDQTAVVILDGAGDDLGRGSRAAIHQYD